MDAYMLNLILTMLLADILILAVYVISPMAGETAGFRWRKFLWVIISVRLLVPVHFLQSLLPLPVQTIVLDELVSIHTLKQDLEEQTAAATTSYESNILEYTDEITEEQQRYLEPESLLNPYIESADSLMRGMSSTWFYLGWGIGAALLFSFRIIQFISSKKYIRLTSKACTNTYIQDVSADLCQTYHIKKQPELLLSKKISSPMISGYIKPKLILPANHISIDDIEMVLSHELIHYKKKDLWYKLFFMFVCDLFWFNPVLRIMKQAADRDIEYLCDETVAQTLSLSGQKAYASMILNGVSEKKERRVAFSTHFIEKESTVEERIENIFSKKRRWKGWIALCFFLSATVLSCCLRISIRTVSAYDRGMLVIGNETVPVPEQTDAEDAPAHPSEYAISEIRKIALAGLSENEIEDFHNFIMEMHDNWRDLENPYSANLVLSDPGAARWNYFHQTGEIVVGYIFNAEIWEKRETLGLTAREFEEKYGGAVYDNNEYDADAMIAKIDEFKQKVQEPLLRMDLDRLSEAIRNARDTHLQKYAVEMYQIIHDMDYYLFRYGPYISYPFDLQERERFYGVLEVCKLAEEAFFYVND